MVPFDVLCANVVLFTILMIPGFLLGKLRGRSSDGMQTVSYILTDIALPFLVFSGFLSMDLRLLSLTELICCILLPIGLALALYALSLLFFKRKKSDVSSRWAENCFCSIFPNCGFLGIPLAQAMFPSNPKVAVLVALFNSFSTLMLLTLGVRILSKGSALCRPKDLLLRPIHFAIVAGIVGSLTHLSSHLPMVATYAGLLAQLTTPLAMIVLGYELSRLKIKRMVTTFALYPVSLLKLIVSPLLVMSVLLILKHLVGLPVEGELFSALLLATAVSTAATAPTMAKQHGADSEHTAILTLGGTVLCMLTLPVVYWFCQLLFAI